MTSYKAHKSIKVPMALNTNNNINVQYNRFKFASRIKNINFGFPHTPMCVSTVYSVLSRAL